MRADAQRNQARILESARSQITEHGSDVSMDQIAKAAGVAVGTLYRHYPTKTDLVQAVIDEWAETLIGWAEEASRSLASPGDAMRGIRRILTDYLAEAAANEAVKAAANVLDADHFAPELERRGRRAIGTLLSSAAADGELRQGVTAEDIFMLMISAPAGAPRPARDRWLDIVMTGIGGPRAVENEWSLGESNP